MVLDPTSRAPEHRHELAPRKLTTLDGVRLGLLANGKRNSSELLGAIATLLGERYALQSVSEYTKPSEGLPVPDAMADQIEEECDVVLAAIGD
jgi:hypothetical protein